MQTGLALLDLADKFDRKVAQTCLFYAALEPLNTPLNAIELMFASREGPHPSSKNTDCKKGEPPF